MRIIDRRIDPVSVSRAGNGKIELRIGSTGRGQGRIAWLSPSEARQVAYALLGDAEREGESN
jgi:hypothetical protein